MIHYPCLHLKHEDTEICGLVEGNTVIHSFSKFWTEMEVYILLLKILQCLLGALAMKSKDLSLSDKTLSNSPCLQLLRVSASLLFPASHRCSRQSLKVLSVLSPMHFAYIVLSRRTLFYPLINVSCPSFSTYILLLLWSLLWPPQFRLQKPPHILPLGILNFSSHINQNCYLIVICLSTSPLKADSVWNALHQNWQSMNTSDYA